ncbi:MAG: FAD-dependent oxidoreductase [Thaumarchaeota archaeon]|nr:FAD-dependent oxidoreductase [Nitrososphaerota archaeon]
MTTYDILIVGGGPAGLSAAIYSSRQGFKTGIITIDIGGQLTLTPMIENYPGVSATSGFKLVGVMMEQVTSFGADLIYDEVIGAEEADDGFRVKTRGGKTYEGKALILAFGKKPRKLKALNEERFVGRGVSYCAVCDAPFYKNKRLLVVGWGESALEAVSILRRYDNEVLVAHESRKLDDFAEKLRELKVEFIQGVRVEEIRGRDFVEEVVLKDLKTGEEKILKVNGIFVELGYVTETDWIKGFVEIDEKGEIIVDELGRTSREGVFAAGDVTDFPYKQAVIAAAQGAIAALSASNYLRRIMGKSEIRSDWRKLIG